jgi:hypothetical protein
MQVTRNKTLQSEFYTETLLINEYEGRILKTLLLTSTCREVAVLKRLNHALLLRAGKVTGMLHAGPAL